ncbi:lytic transglycosylase domain-containing protein [Nocardioides sp. S-58]|uniref:Lytic transglycosylase domain-containing protein n=1 Tax=Nocardioides renjunii TaxID=3095075 RepID=A0ABU5K664_9ACTN|nr:MULTISPECIES: lytic transglycosylase domain-containing protein [unclassified Nocardioides]MDZ5660465.1 lytic transglycosylase domain-containing protein [Nocardioides sp. S-58]WQQ21462.1 lytic transglycosylase domain-containing protein [Nocardioides sp. S-34]
MSKPDKYVPKHRAPGKHKATRAPGRALRTGVALTGLAAVATGVSVTGGVLAGDTGTLAPAAADVATGSSATSTATPQTAPTDAAAGAAEAQAPSSSDAAAALEQRSQRGTASRSARRTDATKATALEMSAGSAVTRSQRLSAGDPRDIARALLPAYGFSADQFSCLDQLYVSESDWRVDADNPTSSAYGIPQALTQLHELPADYMTSAESQIRWGLEYIQDTYGTPCSAWSFKQANNWY